MNENIEFGVEARDKITNFIGIVIGKATYLTGEDQYLLQPQNDVHGNNSQYITPQWINVGQLEILNDGIKIIEL